MAWKASGDHVHLGITKYFLSLPQVKGIGFEPPINSSIWFYQGFKRDFFKTIEAIFRTKRSFASEVEL